MSIQADVTTLLCSFCKKDGKLIKLIRSMHGLYCSNEHCYTRVASGNLVPPSTCEKCKENTFYYESDGTVETGMYKCIACGYEEVT